MARKRTNKDINKLFRKGQALESSIMASSLFNKDNGLHLNSYPISVGKQNTAVDSISVYGNVIVIAEMKNLTMLTGEHYSGFWNARGVKKYFSILNPVKQNEYHVRMMQEYIYRHGLTIESYSIQPYVVVPDDCVLDLCKDARRFVKTRTELESLKSRLSYLHPTLDERVVKIIREGIK